MKKKRVTILSAVGLLVVFVLAAFAYKKNRSEQSQTMAVAEESPLVRAHAQTFGPADAKVTIVEFFDPGCETCRMFADPVKKLLADYPGKVRLVKRYAPFHAGADKVALILEAARLQDKYWETLQMLYDQQQVWASHHRPQPEVVWEFLPSLGLDIDQLRRDVGDPKVVAIVEQDIADAKTLGVHKTPGFFVNGKTMSRFGYEQLAALVAEEVQEQYGSGD